MSTTIAGSSLCKRVKDDTERIELLFRHAVLIDDEEGDEKSNAVEHKNEVARKFYNNLQ